MIFAGLWCINAFLIPHGHDKSIPRVNYARFVNGELRVHLRYWNRSGHPRSETIELYSGLDQTARGLTQEQRAALQALPGVQNLGAVRGEHGWFRFPLTEDESHARSFHLIPVWSNGYSVHCHDISDVVKHGVTYREVRFSYGLLWFSLAVVSLIGLKLVDRRMGPKAAAEH